MKNRSIFFTVLSVFITGAAGFIASIFLSGAPLAVVCCTAALAVFNLIWFMRFDRESDSQARTAVDTFAEKEGQWNKMIQFLSGLRNNSKELNGRVSKSLDAAIIAGGRIGENIRSVEKKTHGLHEQISGASSASEEITATIRHCGVELEKHEQSITQTGTAIEEINANVHSVAAITKQKMSALEQLKDTIGTGAQRVNHTGQSIAEVTSLVNEISGVIQVINTVAAQTNLLSMNAAIEAAHAGEAGKGFAVVADEVRKLAESTAKNSKSISDSIKNIVNKIEEAKKASTVAGETFANIQNETNTFVGAFDEISRAASELSVGMDQILKSITSVKEFSGEIARGAKEMTAGSQNIDEALRQMKDYSQEILNDLEEITHDASDLTGSQSGISQFAVDNNKSMAALYKELETGGFLEKDGLAFDC
jgi:methyl-accepting chemotaxis protein